MAKSNFLVKVILGIGSVLILLSLGIMMTMTPEPKSKSTKVKNIGVAVQSGDIGGDFILVDSNGKNIDSRKLRGKVLLIYFGFTHCPDVCPASIMEMVNAIEEMGEYSKDIQPIFITVDPKRDTPQELRDYFKNVDSRILALTGNEEAIASAAKKFKVSYSVVRDGSEKSDDYLINYSSFYYLVGKDGRLLKYYVPGASGKEIGRNILKYHL
jgi:protein SCO1